MAEGTDANLADPCRPAAATLAEGSTTDLPPADPSGNLPKAPASNLEADQETVQQGLLPRPEAGYD